MTDHDTRGRLQLAARGWVYLCMAGCCSLSNLNACGLALYDEMLKQGFDDEECSQWLHEGFVLIRNPVVDGEERS